MPLGGLLAGAGLGITSGVIGGVTAGNAQSAAQDAAKKAAQQYLDLHIPDPAEQQLVLQRYQQTGELDPRLAQAFQEAQTNMGKITANPELEAAQMGALESLQQTGESGGHTLQEDAYLNQVEDKVNAENRGREGAIEQGYAQRGMGQPGGLALEAQEMNNQNMTEKENEASLQAANEAQQNALRSLQSAGSVAGQMRDQDYRQKAAVAQAQDSINQFNTQMLQGTENENVSAQNNAQAYNVREGQNIANQNTNLSNAEQQYNKGLYQQQYQNELQKAGGAAAGYNGEAGQYNNQANTSANMWGNIGQGALKAGVGVGQLASKKNNPNASSTSSGDEEWW